MKKILLTLASLAVTAAFVSCKKQGGMNSSSTLVSFGITPESAVTRGMPVETAADMSDMGVFAYYTGNGGTNNWAAKGATATANFMNHVKLTGLAGTWSYANKVYWPSASDANVTFFAYSPYASTDNGITVNTGSGGVPTFRYTVPTDCSKQPDLMVSALKTDLNKTTNGSIPVNFQLRHALACIGFKATGNGEKITKIKVTGVKTTGTMTVAQNGIPAWDLTGSASGEFEAIMDENVYLDTDPTLVNTGGGYLMMIPQTLPAGAKLVLSVNDGRDDMEFDIGGQTWASGQRINYCIGVAPDVVIVISPDNLSLPNKGGYSTFNVIEQKDVAGVSWTVNSNQNWILICDNLADLQAWSAGTKSAAQVKNLDGSAPTQSYSYTTPNPSTTGSGTKTLYAWVNTQNASTTANRTGTIALASDATVKTTVNQLLKLDPGAVATGSALATAYVGAFWRADQTGERIIRIPVSGANAGTWTASILSTDANWPADLAVFSTTASTDAGITWNRATENPADMIDNDAAYQVTDGQSAVSGTAVNGGNIYFRIGLKSAYTPTEAAPARYAVVLLSYGTPVKYHAIYLRQGHDPDFVMRDIDPINSGGMNSSTRPEAKRFSPYNLTSPGYNPDPAGTQVPVGGGVFTRYPSQAGALFQWAGTTGKERLAYPVIGTVSGWLADYTNGYWNTLSATHETCPAGYTLGTGATVNFRRPYDGDITANSPAAISVSEISQSLWVNPEATFSNLGNSAYGYYADGFFDRRAMNGSAVSNYTPETDARNANVAYQGRLFFNPNTQASLFFSAPGRRQDNGSSYYTGSICYYWSASASSPSCGWGLLTDLTRVGLFSVGVRSFGYNIRCVRP